MQPIFIATDFSEAATNALYYGGALAQKMDRSVTLLNVYNFPMVPTSEASIAMMPYEEFHRMSKEGLAKSKRQLLEKYPELQVSVRSAIGEIAEQLNEEAKSEEPFLIIIGSRERKDPGVLFGNSAVSIVNDVEYPVLCVPEKVAPTLPAKAILATDLTPIAPSLTASIREIVSALQLELHLVHVTKKDIEAAEAADAVKKNWPEADFKTVLGNDLSEGIEEHAKRIGADLVITLPHSHSWLESLFLKKHTKELVSQLHLPLLCIPERSSF